ncbi:hypothetical protein B0H17DRAFT_1136110 [Mycena rosella]|uniref:Uncharacterized protein n=1 Tax=Mycena rosella TaxID=1033263 RepID=A0AAD7GGF1_MYCRO|nr:hypothetical protein B0H17DRAFT_1136110 [Mycena rosella]
MFLRSKRVHMFANTKTDHHLLPGLVDEPRCPVDRDPRIAGDPDDAKGVGGGTDTERESSESKKQRYKAQRRANSQVTKVPVGGDMPTGAFSEEVVVDGVRFHAVKILHP